MRRALGGPAAAGPGPWAPLLTLFACLALAAPASAAAGLRWSAPDPSGDDHGPGGYRYPIDHRLPPGSLDLRHFELWATEHELHAEACFRRRPLRVPDVHITRYETEALWPQVIDIYLDTDGVAGSGERQALPGRRVRLASGFEWEAALVMAERGRMLSSWLGFVAPALAPRVHPAAGLSSRRRCLRASWPLATVGTPQPGWGITVLVSGARFRPTFRLGDRVLGGYSPDEFTRDVQAVAGSCSTDDEGTFECAFGGCEPCGQHPRVIDALVCGDQEASLSAYSADAEGWAEVTGLRLREDGTLACPAPSTPAPAPGAEEASAAGATVPPGGRVVDVSGKLVSVIGGGAQPLGSMGLLLDPQGRHLARVVVVGEAGPVLLLQSLDGEPLPAWRGATARFGPELPQAAAPGTPPDPGPEGPEEGRGATLPGGEGGR